MLFPPQPLGPLVQNWMIRHRHPISFSLHILGIPPTILGVLLIPLMVPNFGAQLRYRSIYFILFFIFLIVNSRHINKKYI